MRVKELINGFRSRGDPRIEIELDLERILEIAGDDAEFFENIYLGRDIFVRLVLVSGRGVCVIVPCRDMPKAANGREIRRILGISASNSIIIFCVDGDTYVLSWDGMEVKSSENLYELILGFYQDSHGLPGEIWHGIRVLDRSSADGICALLTPLENGDRPGEEPGEMVDEDGQVYVKRYESVGVGAFHTGIAGRQRWFPVSDANTDVLIVKAVFGGWFGLHRFSQGEIGTGLLYVLTCGCVGVLPALDILSYLTGTMYFYRVTYSGGKDLLRQKEKVYFRKPSHKALAIAGMFASVLLGVVAWRFLYQGLGGALLDLFAVAVLGNGGKNTPQGIAEWFHVITESFSWRGGL